MRASILGGVSAVIIGLSGCTKDAPVPVRTANPVPVATTNAGLLGAEPDPVVTQTDPVEAAAVRDRAGTAWEATMTKDWATAFEFLDPTTRQSVTLDEFIKWSTTDEPFIVNGYTIKDVVTRGKLAWVQLDADLSVRKFPDMPSRLTTRWEKWRKLDQGWFPIPGSQLANYPETPALRNEVEEARLRERFKLAWAARKNRDFGALHELSDPRIRPDRWEAPTDPAILRLRFIDHQVQWVQVIGDTGLVRVKYEIRFDDPSMENLPSQLQLSSDKWVLADGEWYLRTRAVPGTESTDEEDGANANAGTPDP